MVAFISLVSVFGLVLRPARYALRGYLYYMEIGQRFGRLVIVREVEKWTTPSGSRYRRFLCKCDCGNEKEALMIHLKRGLIQSCRCLQKEIIVERTKNKNFTQNMKQIEEYNIYHGIRARCSNLGYKNYGDRGIKICERWLESFENFYNDMGPRPSKKHTIDRIDSNGNYEPANCRWATWSTQRENQRRTVFYKINGEEKTLKSWCIFFGKDYKKVYQRIKKLGWSLEEGLEL